MQDEIEKDIRQTIKDVSASSRTLKNKPKLREDKATKPDYTLLPIEGLNRWAARRQFGVDKYGSRDDWKKELQERGVERYIQSLLRHTVQYSNGDRSEDHIGAIFCNAGFIAWAEENILPEAQYELIRSRLGLL